MKVITQRTLVREVADRWDRQYPPRTAPSDKVAIGRALRGLDLATASPRKVDAIIGNNSWTEVPSCDECEDDCLSVVVQLGEEPDYESATANVCIKCLRAALDAAEAAL